MKIYTDDTWNQKHIYFILILRWQIFRVIFQIAHFVLSLSNIQMKSSHTHYAPSYSCSWKPAPAASVFQGFDTTSLSLFHFGPVTTHSLCCCLPCCPCYLTIHSPTQTYLSIANNSSLCTNASRVNNSSRNFQHCFWKLKSVFIYRSQSSQS